MAKNNKSKNVAQEKKILNFADTQAKIVVDQDLEKKEVNPKEEPKSGFSNKTLIIIIASVLSTVVLLVVSGGIFFTLSLSPKKMSSSSAVNSSTSSIFSSVSSIASILPLPVASAPSSTKNPITTNPQVVLPEEEFVIDSPDNQIEEIAEPELSEEPDTTEPEVVNE